MDMINLTEKAITHIKGQLETRGSGIGIRFGVTGAGCGGYSYLTEFVDKKDDHDNVSTHDGLSVYVDTKSMVLLTGMQVDYVTDGFNSGLEFTNPNASTHCGCGESFTI